MRISLLVASLFATTGLSGCGGSVKPPFAAVSCDVEIMLLDGSPLGERPVTADSQGRVSVFMTFDPATIPLHNIDSRRLQPVAQWEAGLFAIRAPDESGALTEMESAGSLMRDDPRLLEGVPRQAQRQLAKYARPASFAKRVDGMEYWCGSLMAPPEGGTRQIAVSLYPAADARTLLGVRRSSGPPVHVKMLDVEFLAQHGPEDQNSFAHK